jgi:hypothetical protein
MAIGVISIVERYGRTERLEWRPSRSQRRLALPVALFPAAGRGRSGHWRTSPRPRSVPVLHLLLTVVSFGLLFTPRSSWPS